ncbi:hypothetical protein EDM00_10600 [Ornithobacterium rhinotracheale]|uniref:DUF6046 domain-containing protein n=1 Tax=Ornithobacterium rhinotracheale TaxID=28251 RepID=UPI00129D192E|nr:DUF6046 domain-containing protein [Ornithobacterium rhinotracheale]MRI64430.1 hypothetical protein [Ornithobacterium rhinotracheale]
MDNRYNISQLFKLAFGVNNPVYLVNPLNKPSYEEPIYKPEVKEVSLKEAERLSQMGTPVIFPIMFEAGDYNFYDKDSRIVKKILADFHFPPATMVDFSRAKNITKTDVIGASGTIKEIYGLDDWSIRIRTLCIADKDMDEREYERRIIEWANVVQSIPVQGDLFGQKNIDNIVIESIDITSVEASPKVIPIELNCVSDEPIEIILR